MLKASAVKRVLYDMGADLCGIAPIERFKDAPGGFHPADVLPSCKSVIAFAKKFPAGTLHCNTGVPYTIIRNNLSCEMDVMSIRFCDIMEQNGIVAVPAGAISHVQMDDETGRLRSIVSAKHSAAAAGLGRIGKNTLLVTPEYGNMVWLNTILTNAALDSDEVQEGNPCDENCSACIDTCPARAFENPEMNQFACFEHAFNVNQVGEITINCHRCRSLCPNCLGSKNNHLRA